MLLLVEWLLEHHEISEALTIGNRLFLHLQLPEKEEQLYTIVEDIEAYYLSDDFASDFDIVYAKAFHEFVKLQVNAYRKIGRLDWARTFVEYEIKILEHIEPENVQENISEHGRRILEAYLLLSDIHFETGDYSQANEIEESLWSEKMDFILEDMRDKSIF